MSHKHRLAKARAPRVPQRMLSPSTILLCLQRNAQMLVFDTWIDVYLLLGPTIIPRRKNRSAKKIRFGVRYSLEWTWWDLSRKVVFVNKINEDYSFWHVIVFIYSRVPTMCGPLQRLIYNWISDRFAIGLFWLCCKFFACVLLFRKILTECNFACEKRYLDR